MSEAAKNIIIRALRLRKNRGEDPNEIIWTYKNLSQEEKEEILRKL